MKNNFFLFITMFWINALSAQNENLVSYLRHLVDSLYKSEVNSNYLWGKGTNGFAEPAIYDGAPHACHHTQLNSSTSKLLHT